MPEIQIQLDEKQREIDRLNRYIDRMVNFIRAAEWGSKAESEQFLKSIGYEKAMLVEPSRLNKFCDSRELQNIPIKPQYYGRFVKLEITTF